MIKFNYKYLLPIIKILAPLSTNEKTGILYLPMEFFISESEFHKKIEVWVIRACSPSTLSL